MKIWRSHSSEHSSRIVMLGRFKSDDIARRTATLLHDLVDLARSEMPDYTGDLSPDNERYPAALQAFLRRHSLYTLSPTDLGHLSLIYHITSKESTIRITTDEYELSALLKTLINAGARVEVFSAHEYPEDSEHEQ